jgi:hypothetical protein
LFAQVVFSSGMAWLAQPNGQAFHTQTDIRSYFNHQGMAELGERFT